MRVNRSTALVAGVLAALSASADVAASGLPAGASVPVAETWVTDAIIILLTVVTALVLRAALLRSGRPLAAQAVPAAALAVPLVAQLVELSSMAQAGGAAGADLLWVAARPGWVALAVLLLAAPPRTEGPRVDGALRLAALLGAGGAVALLVAAVTAVDPSGADHLTVPGPALAAGAVLASALVTLSALPAGRRWLLVASVALAAAALDVVPDLLTAALSRWWPEPGALLVTVAVPAAACALAAGVAVFAEPLLRGFRPAVP
jgi:hypothetical protein